MASDRTWRYAEVEQCARAYVEASGWGWADAGEAIRSNTLDRVRLILDYPDSPMPEHSNAAGVAAVYVKAAELRAPPVSAETTVTVEGVVERDIYGLYISTPSELRPTWPGAKMGDRVTVSYTPIEKGSDDGNV